MKMKKLLSVILAAVLLLGCMSVPAFAASPESDFTFDAETGTITQYVGAGGDVEIPATIGGVAVTTIGVEAFKGRSGLTSVTIPDSVKSIGSMAFFGSGLTSVTIPSSVESFSNAFNECHNLASVTISDGVESISWGAFAGCTSLTGITIPDSVTSIGDQAFCCSGLTSVTIPGTVKSIGEEAFSECHNLASVTISDGVQSIGASAFLNCANLNSVTILGKVDSIEHGAFALNEKLSDVTVGKTTINSTLDMQAFFNIASTPTLHVPVGMVDAYVVSDWGNYFIYIEEIVPEEPGNDFLTSFTLNKDYNDKYSTDAKTTKVNETVSFTITPITENAPAFTSSTFTIDVDDGVGSADVDLPGTDDIDSVGDYWYKIEETAGTTAGVDYDDTTYYLHLIVSYKNGEFGFSSAVVRSSNDVTADENGEYPTTGKIETVTNTYGEGTLTVGQETTVNGEDSSEDTFEATVTFTLPEGTELCGDITYGDNQKVTFDENGVGTVVIELKGGDTVTFEHIPDGVTYTVEQTGKNEDKGYTLDSVVFDIDGETGDTVSDAMIASGTVSDAADTVTITNSKTIPIDVGVILENGAFIVLALGALAVGAWLIISKRRKSVDAE